jgi:deoxyhypusine synthase
MRRQKKSKKSSGPVSRFIQQHFRHFNAAVLVDAARAYAAHLDRGGRMMISMAGAMSTAELGVSLAEMIRRDKVHLITCTGANLEEDVFNLVAHNYYVPVPNYRDLTPRDEENLLKHNLNRVTDVCIPENEAIRRVERALLELWIDTEKAGRRMFPHEFFYQLLREGRLRRYYQNDPKDS